ncbi:hypothetical protein D9756_010140 [Leucocoprinus leucothites]|uniref:Major facilitator superfamily (MFS) profile domain-containing protein n=1 Tax=Leucocoprinus leucothites TaxID=201217 RepID=A0A8H5FT89_9AGAR|nr:hypothetical protein D9756_010140 [Leucoagaricus leucothites]
MPSTEITDEKPTSPSISETSCSVIKQSDIETSDVAEKVPKNQTSSHNVSNGDTAIDEIRGRKEDPSSGDENGPLTSEDDFPDGGLQAWLVVFGAMCSCFATFGYVNSWGIFQAYYQETILEDYSPSAIAWIGSIQVRSISLYLKTDVHNLRPIQYAMIFLPGLFVGRLFDIGYFRSVFLSCSVALVVATFLIAQCTQYWQFLLCQGFVVGLASGGIFGPSGAIIAHWFKKKRGRALGFRAMGSSIGGTVIPIAAKNLIPRIGFPWTVRIIGFILLLVVGICNLTIRRRLPPVNVKGGLFNLSAFRDAPFTIYCASSFFIFLGLYTVLTYVNVSATQLESLPELAFYFVAFANASSLFGRWMSALLADKTGHLNIMIPFTLFAGVLTYAWPFTHSTASLIVVTVIYGFCSGTYISLLSAPIMNLGGEGDVGRRIGMFMTITALGAIAGPPISGAINAATNGFKAVGLYAGSAVVVGIICLVIVRHLVLGKWTGRV